MRLYDNSFIETLTRLTGFEDYIMARIAKIVKKEQTENLIKASVELICRRYMPANKKWIVIHRSGWPGEFVDFTNLSKAQVRKLIKTL